MNRKKCVVFESHIFENGQKLVETPMLLKLHLKLSLHGHWNSYLEYKISFIFSDLSRSTVADLRKATLRTFCESFWFENFLRDFCLRFK